MPQTRVNVGLPDDYGLSLTVYCPEASEANPIETGDVLVWATTGGNEAVRAAAGDPIQLRAKHPVSDPFTPLGVHAYGFSRVETFSYTGTAPAIGASVAADGAGGVTAEVGGVAVTANGSRVVYVDTAGGTVDVLLP